MGLPHRLLGAGLLVVMLVAVGCASKSQTKSRAPVSPVASPPAVRNGAADRDASDVGHPGATAEDVTPNALALHADAYARGVEAMLRERAEAAAQERARNAERATSEPRPQTEASPAADQISGSPKPVQTAVRTAESADVPPGANAPMNVGGASPSLAPSATTRRLVQEPPVDGAEPAGLRLTTPSNPPTGVRAGAAADDLFEKLSARVRDYPRDAAAHLEFQLLKFLRDDPVPDLSAIAALPSEDRELLTTLLDGLSNFRNGLRADANMLQSRKVSPLLELSDRLRAQGELSIPVAALCTDVKLFGVYEPMEPARFTAGGKDNKAILYFEVANFSSQLNAERKYETRLKQEAVLYAEAGLVVWRDKVDTVVDQSRNRRQDFFIADIVRLPETLPVGRYLLKVTVTDLHVNRVAEATVPVEIVAK